MLTNEDVALAMGQMNIMEIVAITKSLEERWGLSALPQVIQTTIKQEEKVKEVKTEFDVVLFSVPADKKIPVIKALREVLGMGLLECKSLVESLPKTIKEATSDME